MRFSEVVDSVESLKEFIKENKITQKEIREIIVVWDEQSKMETFLKSKKLKGGIENGK